MKHASHVNHMKMQSTVMINVDLARTLTAEFQEKYFGPFPVLARDSDRTYFVMARDRNFNTVFTLGYSISRRGMRGTLFNLQFATGTLVTPTLRKQAVDLVKSSLLRDGPECVGPIDFDDVYVSY
jgi:hypothetical protein